MKTAPFVLASLLCALLPAPAGAIEVPQTRREFVKVVAAGARGVAMETFVADQGFEPTYRLLQKKAAACLDVQINRSGFVGNQMEVSSSDYNPTLRRTGAGAAEFTLQVVHRPRGLGHTPPPGGLYVMAADLKTLPGGRTEVVLYRPTIGFKTIVKSFKEWLAGEDAGCPKIR
ncbi:MAG: hypothetical protein ACRD5D_00645 [Candidatus Polarisedimenticolia bacterium]